MISVLILLLNISWSQTAPQTAPQAAPATQGESLLADSKSTFKYPRDGYGADNIKSDAKIQFKNTSIEERKKLIKGLLKDLVLELYSDEYIFKSSLSDAERTALIKSTIEELNVALDSSTTETEMNFFKYNNVRGYLIRTLVHKYLTNIYSNIHELRDADKKQKNDLDVLLAKDATKENKNSLVFMPKTIYDYASVLALVIAIALLISEIFRRNS